MENDLLREEKEKILLKQQDIFQGTLWENIELGRTGIQPKDVIKLAKELGFENFLEQFPNGFDTQLDPTGKKIPFSNTKKILLLSQKLKLLPLLKFLKAYVLT